MDAEAIYKIVQRRKTEVRRPDLALILGFHFHFLTLPKQFYRNGIIPKCFLQPLGIDFFVYPSSKVLRHKYHWAMGAERGTRVIALTYGGKYVFARVWAAYPWAIELTADPHFGDLLRYRMGPMPIPFPREDVYFMDPGPANAVTEGRMPEKAELRKFEVSVAL